MRRKLDAQAGFCRLGNALGGIGHFVAGNLDEGMLARRAAVVQRCEHGCLATEHVGRKLAHAFGGGPDFHARVLLGREEEGRTRLARVDGDFPALLVDVLARANGQFATSLEAIVDLQGRIAILFDFHETRHALRVDVYVVYHQMRCQVVGDKGPGVSPLPSSNVSTLLRFLGSYSVSGSRQLSVDVMRASRS